MSEIETSCGRTHATDMIRGRAARMKERAAELVKEADLLLVLLARCEATGLLQDSDFETALWNCAANYRF